MNADQFKEAHPDVYLLDLDDPEGLEALLHAHGWIPDDARITGLGRAGEGNMNLTLRAETTAGPLIVKQGRPWVEKYPHIEAPWERTRVEGCFYELAGGAPAVRARMPRLLGLDETSHILALEDLGGGGDYTDLYGGGTLAGADLDALVDWLLALHGVKVTPAVHLALANHQMRTLNHEHLFRFPLDPANGLPLGDFTAGLAEAAAPLMADRAYVEQVADLGRLYLADTGDVIVHGDYFPGSWLRTPRGPFVIDPEFAFVGHAALDLGVLAAHLRMARQPAALVGRAFDRYAAARHLDRQLASRFAGVEIMRRLIGVAQLPLPRDGAWKRQLLEESHALVLDRQAAERLP